MKTTRMRSRGKASRSGTPSLDGRLYADCIGWGSQAKQEHIETLVYILLCDTFINIIHL